MIKFEHISKVYKTLTVLDDLNFSINKEQITVLIGESGCGKTTLLKMINRLIIPSSGKISINGMNIEKMDPVALRRRIGYVIQHTGLFPHMTIRQNIELIPKLEKMPTADISNNTEQLLDMVGLEPAQFADRYPSELSGGQQQRVGFARAFAINPDIILMDEPFSSLDPMTTSDLQDEIVRLQSKLKKTIVFVTHDMQEAIKVADMICIMKSGKILQYDTPEVILKNPADSYVSDFVGKDRIWSAPEYIKIADIMIERPITTSQDVSILSCIEKMRHNKVDSLLVTEPKTNRLLGVIKASSLRNISDKKQPASNFMKTDLPTLSPEQSIVDALKIVTEKRMSTVPVVDANSRLVGLVTRSSMVTTLSQQYFDYTSEEQE